MITINILPNISRRKGNKAIKFGKLTRRNERNIFLQTSGRKCGRKTTSRHNFNFQKTFLGGQHLSFNIL